MSGTYVSKIGIGSFTMIMVVGNGLFIPMMPAIQQDLQLTASQTSLLLSVFSFAGAIMIPLSSWLSNVFGRRKVIISCLVILTLGCVTSSLSGFTSHSNVAYMTILIGRILQGVGAGSAAPLGFILASELYRGTEQMKLFSLLEVINGVTKAVSPILGSLLVAYAWQLGFVWYLAIAIVALVSAITLLPQQSQTLSNHSTLSHGGLLHYWRWFVPGLTIGFVVMFLLYGLLFVTASDIQHTGQRGLFISLPLAILVVVSYLYGRTSNRSSKQLKETMIAGMSLLLVASCLACFGYLGFMYTVLSTCVVGGAAGILLPASSSSLAQFLPEELSERALTWLTTVRFLGVASGPVVFSIWMSEWQNHVFYLIGLTGISSQILLICWGKWFKKIQFEESNEF
ncbi:MFS transporter [Alkalicoccobacillus murimartini]|uniref:ACDE family multidrug resistance protein n=1 Tax=Alkalicoccobacillus murimartini TaxID=171685 RepID=A0ABT9YDK7_9BACI|nr:MFS transporter [Alkalicoccobacillus murimartini]MDQ0205575.1 ACDE family multidrug resistance protein [Alkalicoccobacillus murimartini]